MKQTEKKANITSQLCVCSFQKVHKELISVVQFLLKKIMGFLHREIFLQYNGTKGFIFVGCILLRYLRILYEHIIYTIYICNPPVGAETCSEVTDE
jgi:hypothetical protein